MLLGDLASAERTGCDERCQEDDLEGLVAEVVRQRISRRQFLERALAMGLSLGAVGTVLAACGEQGWWAAASPSQPSYPSTKPAEIRFYIFRIILREDQEELRERDRHQIVETYYSSSEELLSKLKAGAKGWTSSAQVTTLWTS